MPEPEADCGELEHGEESGADCRRTCQGERETRHRNVLGPTEGQSAAMKWVRINKIWYELS
jgi:hypothetical protein